LVFCNFSESCSSILWKSWEYKEIAAEALKLTSSDMKTKISGWHYTGTFRRSALR
jgi:hypothetical protein